jgi:hypothetical protein
LRGNVLPPWQRAVVACGAIAEIGGAVLVLVGAFTDNMTAGARVPAAVGTAFRREAK